MNLNNDILTERQRKCVPDVSFELIPIRNLVSNQNYQRPLSEGHIKKALEEFDVYQINPVKVSRRGGVNYVFDGQHTIEIVASEMIFFMMPSFLFLVLPTKLKWEPPKIRKVRYSSCERTRPAPSRRMPSR